VSYLPQLMSRRAAIAAVTLAVTAAGAAMSSGVQAQRVAAAPEVSVEELMKPSDLPDLSVGPADAKVTIVEYSSMTCPHCAAFSTKVFPELKTKYIDTGKVRFISRDFPLDNLAAAAAMLARCLDNDKGFALVETLFATQSQWAGGQGNPAAKLFEIVKQAGFTQESFDKCLTDQALLDKLTAARTRAGEKFQINATPTFFINGKRLSGNSRIDDFDKALEPLLGAK